MKYKNKILDKITEIYDSNEWRIILIDGNTTEYMISRNGDVLNKNTSNILIPYKDKNGYLRVNLKSRGNMIHRLVAKAFIPNPEDKPQVNHIDANKENNKMENLEWATPKENITHSVKLGLNGKRGEDNNTSKYTVDQVIKACEMMMNPNNTPRAISKATGISKIGIYNIRNNNIWTYISKDYAFPISNHKYGEKNINNKYSLLQIHQVCALLENPKLPFTEISKITGVSKYTIENIHKKKVWKWISKEYGIPDISLTDGENRHNSVYTNEQIHLVCKLLEDPYKTIIEISNETNVNKHTISRIENGLQWIQISKNYNIRKRIKPKNPITESILKLLKQGITSIDICNTIMTQFDLPDRRKVQLMISDIKNRYQTKVVCSTTSQK